MTTLQTTPALEPAEPIDVGAELRKLTSAVRLDHDKLGTRRALERAQVQAAADTFGAAASQLTAAKKILDTRHPAYLAVTRCRMNATQYWRMKTVPFPDAGVRLIRRDRIPAFEAQMIEFRAELFDAAGDLQAVYPDMRQTAAVKLGSLYNSGDYPDRIDTCFGLDWSYPSTDPPKYLEELAPDLYAREQERIGARFAEAVRLTEEAYEQELANMVEHLADRLTGDVDGKPRAFRASSIDKIREYVARFRELPVASSEALDALVGQAEKLVEGVTADDLRASVSARDRVSAGMKAIGEGLDSLMVERATRGIIFADEPAEPAAEPKVERTVVSSTKVERPDTAGEAVPA